MISRRAELHLTAWTFSQNCLFIDPSINSLKGGWCVTPKHLYHCSNKETDISIFSGKNHPVLNIFQPWIVITMTISDQTVIGENSPQEESV